MKAKLFEGAIDVKGCPMVLLLLLVALSLDGMVTVMAQDVPVGELSPGQVPVSEKRKPEAYGALSILGTIPKDKNLSSGETTIRDTNVKGSIGVGLKGGVFPAFAGGVFGVEGEVFGHGGKLSAPQAQSDLTAINFMVNVLARYPGKIFQPYVGAGFGPSLGLLSNANIQVRSTQIAGKFPSNTLAYQVIGGIRAYVTKKIFLFGEYKYFAANYTWHSGGCSCDPSINLKFQTQIISGGMGISF